MQHILKVSLCNDIKKLNSPSTTKPCILLPGYTTCIKLGHGSLLSEIHLISSRYDKNFNFYNMIYWTNGTLNKNALSPAPALQQSHKKIWSLN